MAYQLAWADEVRMTKSESLGIVQTKASIDYGALQFIEEDFRRLEKSVAEFQEGENCRSVANVKVVVDQLIRDILVRHVGSYGMNRLSEIYRDAESRYDHRWRFKETEVPTEGRITSQNVVLQRVLDKGVHRWMVAVLLDVNGKKFWFALGRHSPRQLEVYQD